MWQVPAGKTFFWLETQDSGPILFKAQKGNKIVEICVSSGLETKDLWGKEMPSEIRLKLIEELGYDA